MSNAVSIRENTGLTNEQIGRVCPSVYAESKHASRSDRYLYIPTSEILSALRNEGFIPTAAMQAGSRIPGKAEYTKHLLRLRRRDDLGNTRPDVHEIVLVNSHDGTSAYSLMSGVFRCVCTNGLITGDIDNTLRVYHKGNIADDIIAATYEIVDEAEETMHEIDEMKCIPLTRPEQLLLSEFSMRARFELDEQDHKDGKKEVPFEPQDFLRIRRMADREHDLYTTMNVIQENMIKGGISHRDRLGKRHTTRAIHSIDTNVKMNRLLWQFAEKMKELKSS